jgi:hypothetical protein
VLCALIAVAMIVQSVIGTHQMERPQCKPSDIKCTAPGF